jgi:hypothetical protein
MHKSALTFGLLASSLVMLAIMPFLNQSNHFSNVMAQEYGYNEKYPTDEPIVKIKKKIFVCKNVLNPEPSFPSGDEFRCLVPTPLTDYPARPDSGQYIQCFEKCIVGIDESNFAVQIFKDVATVRDLTQEGTKVNLDKFHYTVAESAINKNIDFDTDSNFFPNFPIPVRGPLPNSFCSPSGFAHSLQYAIATEKVGILYDICVNYVGDCEGIIYAGEVKTCTVENYIYFGFISTESPCIRDCPTTEGTTTSQSNNAIPTTTTQSSNIGLPQSSNIGAAAALQSSSVGTPNIFSSAPSSTLVNTPE